VLRHLRRLRGQAADDGDGALLQRFVALRDEAAFAELLRRHGPMVLGVCRRMLGDGPDADDAFQAAFLVLVRKAASVRNCDSLGSWLYGVAARVAKQARKDAARRRAREKQAIPMSPADDFSDVIWRDLRPILDAELQRLPEKYRAPLVLCYLEGHSYEEAARQLGWASGTVCGRLARARNLLRARLTRRGLAPAVALLTAGLSREATAAVPMALLDTTLQAAQACAGTMQLAAVSAPVAALTKGALKAMFWGKVKGALLVVLVLGVLAAAAGGVTHQILNAPSAERLAEEENKPSVDAPAQGDPLPPGALARLGTTRLRFDDFVVGVAFSPDGKTVLGAARQIRFWDAVTGKEARSVKDDEVLKWVTLATSPDGKTLALFGDSYGQHEPRRWISLRDARTGQEIRKLLTEKTPDLYCKLAFTPDGKTLAAMGPGEIVLWEVSTGQKLREFPKRMDYLHGVAFSPDGLTLATSESDRNSGTIYFREVTTGKVTGQFPKETGPVMAFAFSPDGRTLVTGSDAKPREPSILKLWDVANRKEIGRLEEHGHHGAIYSLAFSLDGKTLASVDNYTVRLWDVATYKQRPLSVFGLKETAGLGSVVFSPDGKTLAATADRYIRLWDVASGKELAWEGGHWAAINRLTYSPDGKILASAAEGEPTIRVWDLASGKEQHRLEQRLGRTTAFTPDGKSLVTTAASYDDAVRVWDLATGKESRRLRGEADTSYLIALAPVGDLLAVADSRPTLRLYSWKTGQELRRLAEGVPCGNGMTFSSDGKFLAEVDRPNNINEGATVRVWDVTTGKEHLSLKKTGDVGPLHWLAPAGEGPALVLMTPNQGGLAVEQWDMTTGKEKRRFSVAWDNLNGLRAVSADGRVLALVDRSQRRVDLWDLTTGQRFAACQGPSREEAPSKLDRDIWFYGLTLAPDGRTLVTLNVDDVVQLWEVSTGQEIRHWGKPRNIQGALLAFAPDGRTVASKDHNAILIWDVTGRAKADGLPRIELAPKELDVLWNDLNGENVLRAHDALWALVAAGDQAVSLVRAKLGPKGEDVRRVAKLIADLDADSFEVRERATTELGRLGLLADAMLRQTLEKKPLLEARRRIEALLEKLDGQGYARLARVLQVLEQVGTPEARKALEELANGSREARLTREARASLQRPPK
jgi:RNA polymerase sigma factor (sigma-70 family)